MKAKVRGLTRASGRVILLSTSALGSSVTLECFTTCITTGRRNNTVPLPMGLDAMRSCWASKQHVTQEGGRVGRVGVGRHIVLCRFAALPESAPREIHMEKASHLVLRLVKREQWAQRQRLRWVDGELPAEKALQDAFQVLDDAGLIEDAGSSRPRVSAEGDMALELPLEMPHAVFVLSAQRKGGGAEGACLVAMLEGGAQGGLWDAPEQGIPFVFQQLGGAAAPEDLCSLVRVLIGYRMVSNRALYARALNLREPALESALYTYEKIGKCFYRAERPLHSFTEDMDALGEHVAPAIRHRGSAARSTVGHEVPNRVR